MKLDLEKDQLDLGITPIENMFINTLMANANESQIKVYLYALSLAYSGAENVSNENIAKEMNLTEGQVVDAWSYWLDKKIVEKRGESYIFKSMRALMFESNLQQVTLTTNVENGQNQIQDNPLDRQDTRDMINNIQQFISQDSRLPVELNPREIRKIMELVNDFNVDPTFIAYVYPMASSVRKKKAVDPVVATIRNWMIDGATDMEKLDKYLSEKEKQKEEKKSVPASKTTSDNLHKRDNRMSKDERRAFVENKLQKKIPINKKN